MPAVVVWNKLNFGLALLCRSGQSRGFGSGSQPQVDVLGRLQHGRDRDLQAGRQWEADSVWHRAGEPPGHHSCLLHWVIPNSISLFGLFVLCVFLRQTRAHTLFKTVLPLSLLHMSFPQTDVMSKVDTGGFQASWNPTWSTSDRFWVTQAWIKFVCALQIIFKAVLVETAFWTWLTDSHAAQCEVFLQRVCLLNLRTFYCFLCWCYTRMSQDMKHWILKILHIHKHAHITHFPGITSAFRH